MAVLQTSTTMESISPSKTVDTTTTTITTTPIKPPSSSSSPSPPILQTLTRYLRAVYLLTINDFKVIILPHTLVGVLSALTGPILLLSFPTSSSPSSPLSPPSSIPSYLLSTIPPTLTWNLLNLLCFNLSNQRLPHSISEDLLNKPWRPIPSGLLSQTEARKFLLFLIPLVLILTSFTPWLAFTGTETLLMGVMTWMYNDLGGGDDFFLVRQGLNGVAFGLHTWASVLVAANNAFGGGEGKIGFNGLGMAWCAVVAGVVGSTIQVQDLPDVVGDGKRGRKTMPLVFGDGVCRVSVALGVGFWSVFGLGFWGFLDFHHPGNTDGDNEASSLLVAAVLLFFAVVGGQVARRTLSYRDNGTADERTYKLWCLWLAGIYALPFVHSLVVTSGAKTVA